MAPTIFLFIYFHAFLVLYPCFRVASMGPSCTRWGGGSDFPVPSFKSFSSCSSFSGGSLVAPLPVQSSGAQWGWLRGPGVPSTHVSSRAFLFASASPTRILSNISLAKVRRSVTKKQLGTQERIHVHIPVSTRHLPLRHTITQKALCEKSPDLQSIRLIHLVSGNPLKTELF